MSLKVLVARRSSNNNMASASPWWWDIYLRILPWSGLGHKTLQQQQQKPQLGVMMNLPESPKVLVTESFHNNRSLSWWWWCIHLSLQRSWPQNPSMGWCTYLWKLLKASHVLLVCVTRPPNNNQWPANEAFMNQSGSTFSSISSISFIRYASL